MDSKKQEYECGIKEYTFDPLAIDKTMFFSDGSKLNLPRETSYIGYQICDAHFLVYLRNQMGRKGIGEFKFNRNVLGELEAKIEKFAKKPKNSKAAQTKPAYTHSSQPQG